MFSLTKDEYETHRSCLFRYYLPASANAEVSQTSKDDSTSARIDEKIYNTQKQFINSYFSRFIKTGGRSDDHYDLKKIERDEMSIPQDLSKRYFAMAQLANTSIPSNLSHIPTWLVRHFQYACQLSMDFINDQKFKKMRDLRKSQRGLPICERKSEILDILQKNQVLIIAGDTGCGKSTQVPQYLMAAGYTSIACTQPRRIACTALARRVSYETLEAYGSQVAYQIRFETTKTKRTKMLFLTEGLLLRQMERDSLLQQYNVIILDEVHERHLSSDLLIGLLRDLTTKREDLKLILMSATINLELFSGYFEGAPVIQVPGRLFPIKLYYQPIKQFIPDTEKKNHKIDPAPYVRILEVIDKNTPSTERGDALIFLNGVAEITTVAETLKTYAELTKGWIILMLHSTLSVEEQDKVFDVSPPGVRKCILSTNIAETSVTIDGIRFVIDSGKVNLIKHESSSGTQKLSEFWVSKASANQRKGRAGRTGPGICYRLYSEEQFDKMEDFTASEINRVSLQDMALRMISLGLGIDPLTFPYIERPAEDALRQAMDLLKFQDIVYPERESELTALGYAVAKLPVEVSIAKMLILGCVVDQVDVMLTLAASMSVQSPFTNRSYRELDVVNRRSSLTSNLGDAFTLLNVFRQWVQEKTCGGQSRHWTIENGIDEHRLYEISKLRTQYRQILEDAGLIARPTPTDLGELDSRQRRIDQGDRKKLFDLKRKARNEEKTRKVLRADKHFDDILCEKEEDDIEKEQDPMKADVSTVEFLLSHKQRDVQNILRSHKLRSKDSQMIRVVIAAGLYPNFALLDGLNKYKHGQELFTHTRLKPYCQIHPNSTMAQYHSESLDSFADQDGYSKTHQIPFYSLLLETTKPYICNVLPLPALSILLVSKKVISESWNNLLVDDFVEMEFKNTDDSRELLEMVKKIRAELNKGLARKLKSRDFDSYYLRKEIDRFFRTIEERGINIKLRRLVDVPPILEDCGFHLPDGDFNWDLDQFASEGEDIREDESMDDTTNAVDGEEEKPQADPFCPKTRDQLEDEEERAEKRQKEVKKESYYEKLLKRQREKEEETTKRVKTEETE